MQRRNFIRTSCLACLGGSAVTTLLQGCSSTHYAQQVQLQQNSLVVKKSEFIEIKKGQATSNMRNVVVAKYEKLAFPVAIFRLSEDQYSAVYLECTHQGNEVQPQGNYLVCEGYFIEFDSKGNVTQGPAEDPLRTFSVKSDKDNIYILLS